MKNQVITQQQNIEKVKVEGEITDGILTTIYSDGSYEKSECIEFKRTTDEDGYLTIHYTNGSWEKFDVWEDEDGEHMELIEDSEGGIYY